MGSSPHLWFCACKTVTLGPDLQVCMGPRPHLWFLAHITACLAQEYQDTMGPRPHLRILIAKQHLMVQNYKSLWVPDLTCRFVHGNSVISTRITSLYGFQPSCVVLWFQNSDLKTKLHVSMGPTPHL